MARIMTANSTTIDIDYRLDVLRQLQQRSPAHALELLDGGNRLVWYDEIDARGRNDIHPDATAAILIADYPETV